MTRHKQWALTGAAIALLLAVTAAPLTVDRHGGVGINQALAKGSHRAGSEPGEGPGPEPGEGSAKDAVADAKAKKAAIDASQDMIATNRIDALLSRLSVAEMKAKSPLARAFIEKEEARLQATLKKV